LALYSEIMYCKRICFADFLFSMFHRDDIHVLQVETSRITGTSSTLRVSICLATVSALFRFPPMSGFVSISFKINQLNYYIHNEKLYIIVCRCIDNT